jgi:hypothetical protein
MADIRGHEAFVLTVHQGRGDEEINIAFGDFRPYLLVAAERAALEFDDREIEESFQQAAGGSSSVNDVVCKQLPVIPCPFEQVVFLVIVRDQRDLFAHAHGQLLIFHTSFKASQ